VTSRLLPADDVHPSTINGRIVSPRRKPTAPSPFLCFTFTRTPRTGRGAW
jgi:hypothetical protein